MKRRLAGCKTKFLNLIKRTVLAKATLSSIPSHVMQYIKLPTKTTSTINKVQRDFVWDLQLRRERYTFSTGIVSLMPKTWEDWVHAGTLIDPPTRIQVQLSLMARLEITKIEHVFREQNRVADKLVKQRAKSDVARQPTFSEAAPIWVQKELDADVI
ncbi:hypothetical protein MTR67_034081 [Solanum verrucosum]|uniref:RNase H type-1 domain-containing protein n=1 Tax=Solanum verrucosum TaxID=315347 RepID=A0AAF0ZI87_SOLVR|nr:hypothetical protein MTR67_034081 [Solanum verrucosum]